jgi:hypothetical protein
MKKDLKEYIDSIPYYGSCTIEYKEGIEDGVKWQADKILEFINNEDNHTEGELGNSCIDVKLLIHFLNN